MNKELECGCVSHAAKKHYLKRVRKAEKDYAAVCDPDFGKISYTIIDRRYKLYNGRAKSIGRYLGIALPKQETQYDKLASMHNSGEIDLNEISNSQIRERFGYSNWATAKARQIVGVEKASGSGTKVKYETNRVNNLLQGWGRCQRTM